MSVSARPPDGFVIGVDFGTLSGRAVVVRVARRRRGRQRRYTRTAWRHGPVAARRRAARCRPTGPCRTRTTTATCCGSRPAALAASGRRPGEVIGIGTDFTACTVLPDPRRRHAAVRAPRAAPTARTPTSKLWKHHAAQPQADRINALAASAASPGSPGTAGKISVGVAVRQGAAAARGGPGDLRARRTAGSRPPTGSSGSCTGVRRATCAPPATRPSTRTAATPRADYLAALTRGFAEFVRDKLDDHAAAAGRTGRRADRQAAALDRAAARASPWPSATSTPTSRPRPPQAVEPGRLVAIMGTSTCHVMTARAGRGAGHVRRGRRWHHRRPLGLRGRARAASATSSPGSSSTPSPPSTATRPPSEASPARAADRAGGRPTGRRRTAWWRWTGTTATGRCWSTTTCRAARRADPGDAAAGDLPGADRGHRLRHPHDHRGLRDGWRAGATSSSSPAACSRTRCSCRSTPTSPAARCGSSGPTQGPALGSAIHAAVAAGAYPDVRAAVEAMGRCRPRRLSARRRPAPTPTTRLYAEYPRAARPLRQGGGNDVLHRLRQDPVTRPGRR